MSIVSWVVLGLLSGFIASKLVSGAGKGLVMNLVFGVVGAFVGGALFNHFGELGVTGLNAWSVLVAVVGAIVVLVVYHALARLRRT